MSIRIGNNIITSITIASSDVTSALGYTPADQASLATVATSGDYTDLINIPTVDQTYDGTSTNAQSGTAVAFAIGAAISTTYKAAGSTLFANLPALSSAIEGNVYNITDSFTTTADFVEGAGNTYGAGTNIVCINTAASGQIAVYKWDVLGGFVDQLPSQTGQSGKFLTTNGSTTSWVNVPTEIPSQSGNSGKYLTTNGTSVSWATVDALPSQTGNANKFLTTNGTSASWSNPVVATLKVWGAGE